MADIYNYITSTGTIVPDTSVALSEVQGEYKSALGQDLIVTPDTPQGVLITAEALSRDAIARNNAELANQINPNIAGGVFLDAICALLGIERVKQTRSIVTAATLGGVAGTIIPQGIQAKTGAGDIFQTTQTVILDATGAASVDFESLEYGAITCGAGELTQIVSDVLGWETVTNYTAATLGRSEQSDAELRAYRKNVLAFQGVALIQAIHSALYAVEGVRSCIVRENTAATTQTIDGVSMVAHSVYACVDGGTDSDVAAALLENKSAGCGWNGTTTVNLIEPVSGQSYPVKFSRPAQVDILVKVTIKSGLADDVKAAIMAYANGELDGEAGFIVGGSVSPFELAGAINRIYPTIYVQKVELSLISPVSYAIAEIPIGIYQIAHTQSSYITVVIA